MPSLDPDMLFNTNTSYSVAPQLYSTETTFKLLRQLDGYAEDQTDKGEELLSQLLATTYREKSGFGPHAIPGIDSFDIDIIFSDTQNVIFLAADLNTKQYEPIYIPIALDDLPLTMAITGNLDFHPSSKTLTIISWNTAGWNAKSKNSAFHELCY